MTIKMMNTNKKFEVTEVGVMAPGQRELDELSAGDVGYIAASIKDIRIELKPSCRVRRDSASSILHTVSVRLSLSGVRFLRFLHLPGGNALLSIGMGTEVLMFVLTAFDRPPREYHWEEVFPVLNTKNPEDRPEFKGGNGGGSVIIGGNGAGVPGQAGEGGTINVVGGGSVSGTVNLGGIGGVAGGVVDGEGMKTISEQYMEQMAAITEQMEQLRTTTEALNKVSTVLSTAIRPLPTIRKTSRKVLPAMWNR